MHRVFWTLCHDGNARIARSKDRGLRAFPLQHRLRYTAETIYVSSIVLRVCSQRPSMPGEDERLRRQFVYITAGTER